jgi:hypothetical protein
MINLNNEKKNIVLFDIDSASISGAVFEYRYDNKTKKVIYKELSYLRVDITNGQSYDFAEFYGRTLKALDDVAQKLYLQTLVPVDALYINLSTPWSSNQKRIIEYSPKKEFIITKELVDELIEKEIESPLSQNMDFYHHEVVLFDRKTIDIYAHGYPTKKYLGKKVFDMQIHSLTSVMSDQTKSDFEHVIERVFHRKPILVSNMFVRYDSLRKLFPNQNSAIILDVSGETTECVVVVDDHLVHTGSFPVGAHSISRFLAKQMLISPREARTYLNLIQEDKLTEIYNQKYLNTIDRSFAVWLESCYLFFDEMSKKGLLPETLVVSMADDVRYWFSDHILQSDELSEHIKSRKRLELLQLDESTFIGSEKTSSQKMNILASYVARNEVY